MTERYGWDQTPTPDLGLDISKAPADIQKLYKWVIEKRYGEDVASAYGQAMVLTGIIAKNAEAMSLFTSGQMDTLDQFVKDTLIELTDKDIISAPEIIMMRDGEDTANDRLVRDYNNVTARLAQTENNVYDNLLNVHEMGAVGDYYLNGDINPSPTDDYPAIQATLNEHKFIKLANRLYYCSQPIKLPQGAVIEGNGATIFFDNDGIDLGTHSWNRTQIRNITIENRGRKKTGRGIFTEDGYLVYNKFENINIYGFETGFHTIANDINSNLSWCVINNLRIEECVVGFHLYGGWANTVKINNLFINYTDSFGIFIENCIQFHNFIIARLTLEQVNKNKDMLDRTVYLKNCRNGEIFIKESYIEGNGYQKSATLDEKNDFKLNGVKVQGFFTDSKTWELNGMYYSEDSNFITHKNDSFTLNFEDCSDIVMYLNDTYITTALHGIAGFNNSNVTLFVDSLHLTLVGSSFNNTRELFGSSLGSVVTLKTKRLTNSSGGYAFKYGVLPEGDFFGISERGLNYGRYSNSNNVTLPLNSTIDVPFSTKHGGGIDIYNVEKESDTTFKVNVTGLYQLDFSFVMSQSSSSGVHVSVFSKFENQFGKVFANVKAGEVNTLSGCVYLNKGDAFMVKCKNNSMDGANAILGTSNNVNFLTISKLI